MLQRIAALKCIKKMYKEYFLINYNEIKISQIQCHIIINQYRFFKSMKYIKQK